MSAAYLTTPTVEANVATTVKKPKRIRRWAKRPANPNDEFPNASLSVRDVRLIVHELESYEERIAGLPGFASARRRVRKLIEKLGAVKWA